MRSSEDSWLVPPSPAEILLRPATSAGVQVAASVPCTSLTSSTKQKNITEDQARWFLSLPDKIRRQQFTREEQLTLMVRCKKVLQSSSPELAKDVYRKCSTSVKRQSRIDLTLEDRPVTSAATSVDELGSYLELDSSSVHTTDTSNAEMKIFKLYARRSKAKSTPPQADAISVPPPPPPVDTGPERPPTPVLRKKPSRRRLSLTPLPLPPPILAPPVPAIPPMLVSTPGRPISMSARLSRPYMDFLTLSTEPTVDSTPATESYPYDNVDIRKQLRKSLMSTENFNKLLEHGYDHDMSMPVPSSTSDFLPLQNSPSSLSDYSPDDGDDSTTDVTGPRTPTPTSGQLLVSNKLPSFDSGISMPLGSDGTGKYNPALTQSSREMTIHMTLTRLEVRSPEEELYSTQRRQVSGVDVERNDPLALESLPVCDDPTGAHGAFALPGSSSGRGWKKVLRTLRGQ